MNVLCVNHTGAISGAEHSLLDLLAGLPDEVNVRLACPSVGPLADAARQRGTPIDRIPGTAGSLKLHPRETPVALSRLALAAAMTARHARRMRADLIHANSIRAGLLTVPAARLAGIPAVVHVRDRLPRSGMADASLRLIAAGSEVVAANSRYTAEGVSAVAQPRSLRTVYNPVDLARFNRSKVDRQAARTELGLSEDVFVAGVVGQITPWKGQLEAVEAIIRLRAMGRAAHLLIVGEPKFVSSATRYDNRAYSAELHRIVSDEDLHGRVHFLGERSDIPRVMGSLDALLVPSWEEPFGRVIIEAMGLGLPVVATAIGGPSEIITDGVNGLLLPPRQPRQWADAVARLADAPDLRGRLGDGALRRAEDFAVNAHVQAMRAIYEEATRA